MKLRNKGKQLKGFFADVLTIGIKFCLFELKKPPWPFEWSLGWKRFLLSVNCMSGKLAVWLGEDRKCFAALVGSDLASASYLWYGGVH